MFAGILERGRYVLKCIYWWAVTMSYYVGFKTEGTQLTSVQGHKLKQHVQLFSAKCTEYENTQNTCKNNEKLFTK